MAGLADVRDGVAVFDDGTELALPAAVRVVGVSGDPDGAGPMPPAGWRCASERRACRPVPLWRGMSPDAVRTVIGFLT